MVRRSHAGGSAAKVMRAFSGRMGALTIRDIEDDVLVEKVHAWASRKAVENGRLQLGVSTKARVTISERNGMLKTL